MTSKDDLSSFDEPKLEALVETMFHAAHADGDFSDEERSEFKRNIETLTDTKLDAAGVERLLAKAEAVAGEGREARLPALKDALGPIVVRKIAFELAIKVVAADGIIRTSERELLLEIAEAFEIDRDQAADLVKSGSVQ